MSLSFLLAPNIIVQFQHVLPVLAHHQTTFIIKPRTDTPVVRVSVEIITWNRILTHFFNPASLVVFDVPSLYWIVRVYMWPYRGRVEWSFHTSSALYRVIAIVTIYCDTQYTWWIKWLLHVIKYREIATDLLLMSKSEFSQIKTSIPTTITQLFNCVLMTTLFT